MPIKKASEALRALLKREAGVAADCLSVGEIMESLHGRGFGVLMLLFGLPLSIPIPVPPGYTTILGTPLLFMSLQMVMGSKTPWMPRWLKQKSMKRSTLATIIEKTSPMLVSIERIMRPRMEGFISGVYAESIYGAMCLLFSISIVIPLPLTNFIPASGICLISLGLMSRDGLFAVLGAVVGFVGLVVTAGVVLFGAVAVRGMFKYLGFDLV